jgi:hypothetical protein
MVHGTPQPNARRSAAKQGVKRESSIEYEIMEPQEMIDGLVQVLREVYSDNTFRTLRCTKRS